MASAGSSVAAASGTRQHQHHRHPAARRHRHLHRRGPGQPRGHRLVDQHRHGGRAARGHHPGQQQLPPTVDSLTPLAGLAITKTDGQTTAVPGTHHHLHHHGQQRRPCCRHRARAVRPPAGRRHCRHLAFAGATGGGSVTGPQQRHARPGHHGQPARRAPPSASASRSMVNPSATGSLVNTATVTPPGDAHQRHRHRQPDAPGRPVRHQDRRRQPRQCRARPTPTPSSVSNAGPSTVSSLTLTDTVPAALLNPAFGTPSRAAATTRPRGLERAEPGGGAVGEHHPDGHHRPGGHRHARPTRRTCPRPPA